jgi:nucleoside-triphosphatase THEP1
VKEIKLIAHRLSLAMLAPGAVISAIEKTVHPVTDYRLEESRHALSSYLRVKEDRSKDGTMVSATEERADDQILSELKANPQKNILVVKGPPGSGKTTLMNNLEVEMREQGWVVIRINFDDVIPRFFRKEEKQTKEWSEKTAEEFDKSFFDLNQVVAEYYPHAFKDKRFIVMIDTLGYNIDDMLYGLGLVKLLKTAINEGNALVVSVIAQRAVIEKARKERSKGQINVNDGKSIADQLKKSGGAPVSAFDRHHLELGKKVNKSKKEPAFDKVVAHADVRALEGLAPEVEIKDMIERLAYAIITRNGLEIRKNWWFIFNIFHNDSESPKNPS